MQYKNLEIQDNILIITDEEYPEAIIPLDDVVKLATIYDETKKAYLIELYFYNEQKVDGFACFPTIMFNGKMLHVLTPNYHESYCQDIQLIQDIEHDSFICVSDKRALSEINKKELIYINFEFLDDVKIGIKPFLTKNILYELSNLEDLSNSYQKEQNIISVNIFSIFTNRGVQTKINDIPFVIQKIGKIKNKSKKITKGFEFLIEHMDNGILHYKTL